MTEPGFTDGANMSDKTLQVVKVAKDAAYIQMADLERLRAEVVLDSILVGLAWVRWTVFLQLLHDPQTTLVRLMRGCMRQVGE